MLNMLRHYVFINILCLMFSVRYTATVTVSVPCEPIVCLVDLLDMLNLQCESKKTPAPEVF